MGVCAQKPGHEDAFYNNSCVMMGGGEQYASFQNGVGGPALPVMHDNRVFTQSGKASESGKPVEEWQKQGHDLGTVVATLPSDDDIVAMGRAVLGM